MEQTPEEAYKTRFELDRRMQIPVKVFLDILLHMGVIKMWGQDHENIYKFTIEFQKHEDVVTPKEKTFGQKLKEFIGIKK